MAADESVCVAWSVNTTATMIHAPAPIRTGARNRLAPGLAVDRFIANSLRFSLRQPWKKAASKLRFQADHSVSMEPFRQLVQPLGPAGSVGAGKTELAILKGPPDGGLLR